MKKSKISVRMVALSGLFAALYFVTTYFLSPLSFGNIQFRFSEILNLLAFIHPVYIFGVSAGCFLANLLSPDALGIIDVIVGSLSTAAAMFLISKTKHLSLAALWPVIFTLPVAVEVSFYLQLPIILTALTIMAGEFAVLVCVGYPLFKYVILKNKELMRILSFAE